MIRVLVGVCWGKNVWYHFLWFLKCLEAWRVHYGSFEYIYIFLDLSLFDPQSSCVGC